MVKIQVKTASKMSNTTSWPLSSKAQLFSRSPHEWFVFVLLPQVPQPPKAFVVPRDYVSAATWIAHQDWLTDPGVTSGKRNAGLDRARVREAVWADTRTDGICWPCQPLRCQSSCPDGCGRAPWRNALGYRPGTLGQPPCQDGDFGVSLKISHRSCNVIHCTGLLGGSDGSRSGMDGDCSGHCCGRSLHGATEAGIFDLHT